MKIVIIDNLYAPNKVGKVGNGVQKFSKMQRDFLSRVGDDEIWYITAKDSDVQYEKQIVLDTIYGINDRASTKEVIEDLSVHLQRLKPDVVLDNSCKHMSSLWKHYGTGVIFEHYYHPFAPINASTKEKFEKNRAYWVGVSHYQNRKFNYAFHDVIDEHCIVETPNEILNHKGHGVFIRRWDSGKRPHVALRYYLKTGLQYPIDCYIKFGGKDENPEILKELMQSPLLRFHIDAPREEIFKSISTAAFGLGMAPEAAGIVGIECASHGVPYIVHGHSPTAEMEHIPPEGILFCDMSNKEKHFLDQLKDGIEKIMQIPYEQRYKLSVDLCTKYTVGRFIADNQRIINKALNYYGEKKSIVDLLS